MKTAKWTAAGVAMLAICGGCSIAGGGATAASTASQPKESTAQTTQLLRGSVSPSERRLQNARVMAISPERRVYAAPIDANGDFVVKVPAGRPYRIVIANTTLSATRRAIGHLVVGQSRWAILNASRPVIDLGMLHVKTSASAPTPSSIHKLDHESDLQGSDGGDPSASGDDAGDGEPGADHTVEEPKDELCGEAKDPKDDSKKDADVELTTDADPQNVSAENNHHEGDDQPLPKCGPAEGGGNDDVEAGVASGDGQGDAPPDDGSDPFADPDAADPDAGAPADPDAAAPADPDAAPSPDAGT